MNFRASFVLVLLATLCGERLVAFPPRAPQSFDERSERLSTNQSHLFTVLHAFVSSEDAYAFVRKFITPGGHVKKALVREAQSALAERRLGKIELMARALERRIEETTNSLKRRHGARADFSAIDDIRLNLVELEAMIRLYRETDPDFDSRIFPDSPTRIDRPATDNKSLRWARTLVSIANWPSIWLEDGGESGVLVSNWDLWKMFMERNGDTGLLLFALRLNMQNGGANYGKVDGVRKAFFKRLFVQSFQSNPALGMKALRYLLLFSSGAEAHRRRGKPTSIDRVVRESASWNPLQTINFLRHGLWPEGSIARSTGSQWLDDYVDFVVGRGEELAINAGVGDAYVANRPVEACANLFRNPDVANADLKP